LTNCEQKGRTHRAAAAGCRPRTPHASSAWHRVTDQLSLQAMCVHAGTAKGLACHGLRSRQARRTTAHLAQHSLGRASRRSCHHFQIRIKPYDYVSHAAHSTGLRRRSGQRAMRCVRTASRQVQMSMTTPMHLSWSRVVASIYTLLLSAASMASKRVGRISNALRGFQECGHQHVRAVCTPLRRRQSHRQS
jgi:hypothetical protein